RYRQMPRFGVDTIWRFATNASEMKKLAARDFEDLLQCAIPAFDGLFPPEHNERVLKLLFRMAEWHAFAKLRMHTDPTLEHLRRLTPEIGRLVREFKSTTCTEFADKTFELPREVAARGRREQRAADARAAGTGASAPAALPAAPTEAPTKALKKVKTLNLNIYKWHAMGDYVPAILLFGPTDGFSTQLVRYNKMTVVSRGLLFTGRKSSPSVEASVSIDQQAGPCSANCASLYPHESGTTVCLGCGR
ncbi:hypothetical protein B0H16DRAFT_1348466, partial [Mycena metata]